jgi:hypothetical protein
MDLGRLLNDIREGYRLTEQDAAALLNLRGREVFSILAAAEGHAGEKGRNYHHVRAEPEHPYHKYL